MTPGTKTQNLLIWAAALGVSMLLALLSGIATHWPEGGDIDWRGVVLDVIQVALAVVPVVAAGLGLPRLGKEPIAALVSQVGPEMAKTALEVAAISQETGVPMTSTLSDDDIGRLADRIIEENARRATVRG